MTTSSETAPARTAGAIDPRQPCIIGVATHTYRGLDAPEPLDMWEGVASAAAYDTGADTRLVLDAVDSFRVTYCQTWQYDDAAGRLSERLGITPRHRHYSGIGGTVPQQTLNDVAEGMQRGDLDVALVASAEALATQRAYKRRGERAAYSFQPAEKRPFPLEAPFHPAEANHDVLQAWLTFALFDNARRARLGVDLDEYRAGIGEMMSPMTHIAAANSDAWFPTRRTADEIVAPTPENRMVGYPYTKYMVAVMDVDMAAALVVATHAAADELGVPKDRRVYLRGWGYGLDPTYVAEHGDLSRSPAMEHVGRATLAAAGVGIDDIAHLDLYSCFASSLHFVCDALGITVGDPRPLTLTGGLPYHGGPGSGYMTHSIAAMTNKLRSDPRAFGLTTGVGMHMTKHAFGVYSASPGPATPADLRGRDRETPVVIVDEYSGDAIVDTYSVVHDRDGNATHGVVICEIPGRDSPRRTYGVVTDADALAGAESSELVGATVRLHSKPHQSPLGAGTRNHAEVVALAD